MTADVVPRSPVDIAVDLWQRRHWLMLSCFTSVAVFVISLAVALPPLFSASTTMLFGQDDITESMVRTSVGNEFALRLAIIQQAVLSRAQIQQVIDTYDLYPSLRRSLPPEVAIERFRKDVAIEQHSSKQAQWGQNAIFSVKIRYQGWDPELVAAVANELAARFKRENRRIRTGQASRTTAFIARELEEAKKAFITEESRINNFKNQHIGELPEQQQINLVTLGRLNAELRLNGEKQLRLLGKSDLALQDNARETPVSGLSATVRLEQLKRRLAEQRTRYTEAYPGIVRLRDEINSLERALAISGDSGSSDKGNSRNVDDDGSELARLKRDEIRLNRNIAELMHRIESTPKIDQQLKRFAYDYESAKEEYLSLQKKYQEAQLAESLEAHQYQQFKVIEAAIAPAFPSSPNRMRLMFMGIVIAGVFTASALFWVEIRDQSFHLVDDIRQFTTIPVLASIRHIQTPHERAASRINIGLLLAALAGALILLSVLGYSAGSGAEQLVWALSR